MDWETFKALPVAQVAWLVRQSGPKVCVFPINGTRRWFLLEYRPGPDEDPIEAYLDMAGRCHLKLYQILFDHGLDTLLTPVFGPDLVERGPDYMAAAARGLAMLATDPRFLEFYTAYRVRVRFYGDYRRFFGSTPHAHLPDLFDQLTTATLTNDGHRLFFGVCAQDATETIAQLAVEYYRQTGQAPDKRALIERYYGEYVAPVDLFIGFDKFCAFDMPLVATGNEDLYFTVCPSLYLTEEQLRGILYDHLYSRGGGDPDYAAMGPEEWEQMRRFYRLNRGKTLGVGVKTGNGGVWYPLPQVEWPAEWPITGL